MKLKTKIKLTDDIVGLDLGQARTGVARLHVIARIAEPLSPINMTESNITDEVIKIINGLTVSAVVCGLPRGLDGQETEQTLWASEVIKKLESELPVPVFSIDEAGTTKEAELRAYGGHSVDSVAACIIVEGFINEVINGKIDNVSICRYNDDQEKSHLVRNLFVSFVLLVISFIVLFSFWYRANLSAIEPNNTEQIEVVVPDGASESDLASILSEKGIIKSKLAYRAYTHLNFKRGNIKAGTYNLSKNMSVTEIVSKITSGEVAVSLVTILPSQRLQQIKAKFIEEGYTKSEVDRALDPKQYEEHPALEYKPAGASLEGYLYPESFQVTPDTPLTVVIEASLDQFYNYFTPELIEKFNKQGLTPHQAVIIASLVEGEVSDPEDRPKVAQVFLKRLNIDMVLGSDVSAHYGASLLGLPETVSVDSPYNTRIYGGLPPGPTSNVSASSLYAVAEPSNTDFLYFVSGDDGITHFSNTLSEHEALTARYCTVLCALP